MRQWWIGQYKISPKSSESEVYFKKTPSINPASFEVIHVLEAAPALDLIEKLANRLEFIVENNPMERTQMVHELLAKAEAFLREFK